VFSVGVDAVLLDHQQRFLAGRRGTANRTETDHRVVFAGCDGGGRWWLGDCHVRAAARPCGG
jgi:hypothetical protein